MKTVVRMFFIVMVIALVVGCGRKQAGIEGKVIDGKGQPLSGVKVIAKRIHPIKGYEQFETSTGSDGVFKFKDLFPTSEYSIFPWSDKWKTSAKVTVWSAPEGQTSMLPSPMIVRFTLSSDGIIIDSQLGLQWASAPDQPMNWFQAANYAQNLSLGGGGWRLPTRLELKSIYNKSMKGGAADTVLQIKDDWVWTSETQGDSAWYFNFYNGKENAYNRDYSSHNTRVLAVRSGK
jgi:hypothetical protein